MGAKSTRPFCPFWGPLMITNAHKKLALDDEA
jgi:hypothetical protein